MGKTHVCSGYSVPRVPSLVGVLASLFAEVTQSRTDGTGLGLTVLHVWAPRQLAENWPQRARSHSFIASAAFLGAFPIFGRLAAPRDPTYAARAPITNNMSL